MDPLRLNPHVALSVAAALAHRQLSDRRQEFYDVEHYSEALNLVAQALLLLAQVYVADGDGGEPRTLSASELTGADVRRGATVLALADGRSFRHLSLRRDELRDAISVLGRTGLKGVSAQQEPK